MARLLAVYLLPEGVDQTPDMWDHLPVGSHCLADWVEEGDLLDPDDPQGPAKIFADAFQRALQKEPTGEG